MAFLAVINFLLNLAGLLLWFKWRSFRLDPLARIKPATLTGTLRRAEPSRLKRWHLLAALAALLVVRSWFYWQVGSAVDWVAKLRLEPITVSFRSDFFSLMLLFSTLSFVSALGVVYLWLLLVSLVNGKGSDQDPCQGWVRLHLGRIEGWPWLVKLLLPLLLAVLFWMAFGPLLESLKIIPSALSTAHRLEQGLAIGLGVFLIWKYLVGIFLFLGLLNSYVYLGDHPGWAFIGQTSRNLAMPLRPLRLRVGRLDFAPVLALALVFVVAEMADRGLVLLYTRLPL